MGFDLENLAGGTDPGKGNASSSGTSKGFDINNLQGGTPNAFLGGPKQSIDFNDFSFQPKTNADNYKLRAQDQGFLESTGIRLGNLVPNIAGGIIESVGYMGALATEWGDDRDYNNALTQFGNAIKSPLGQVYRENPEKVWDPSDPAWWGDAFFGLAESALSFAATGAGMAKVFGGITSLAKAAGVGRTGLQVARATAQTATAASLAYAEGAMSGATVFDQTVTAQYKKLIEAGVDPDEANQRAVHLASQAAASTVQLNTIINTALNLTALTPIFKSNDDILDWWTTKGRRGANESFGDWATRIRGTVAESADIQKLLNPREGFWGHALEAGLEGIEEMVNQFAEKRGMDRGEKGKETSLSGLFNDLGHFFEDTMDQEGALNFVLGAFGGVAQTVALDHIPMHKVYKTEDGKDTDRAFEAAKDSNGKYKTKLVTSAYRNAVGGRSYFENVKDKVVADIDRVEKLNTDLATAISKGETMEAERIKAKMFDAGALNAVGLGLASNFKAQYEDIAKLDNTKSLHEALLPSLSQLGEAIANETDQVKKQELQQQYDATMQQVQKLTGVTEAMQKGYAKDKDDNEYKRKAEEAARLVDEYDALWKDISAQHRSGDDWDSRYADYLFNKEIAIRSGDRILEEEKRKLTEARARRAKTTHPDEDPLTIQSIKDIHADTTAADNLKAEEAKIRRALALVASDKEQDVAQGKQMLAAIADKYEMMGDSEEDIIPAAQRVLGYFKDKQETLLQKRADAIDSIGGTTQYQKWKEKNPGKTIVDFINSMIPKVGEDYAIAQQEQKIRNFETERETAKRELEYTRSRAGKVDYINKAKAYKNAMIKKMNARIQKQNDAFTDSMYDNQNVTALSKVQRSEYLKMLEKKEVELEDKLKGLNDQRKAIAEKLMEMTLGGFLKRLTSEYRKLQSQQKQILDKIDSLETALATLRNRMDEVQNSAIPTESVLPQQTATPAIPTSSSDDDVRVWIGDDNVYSDLLDGIWAIRQTDDAAINAAFDLLQDQLAAITHPWLRETSANQTASTATIVPFLTRHLIAAGKMTQQPAATTTSSTAPQETAQTAVNPLGKMVENAPRADAYHYKSPAAEINIGKPLGSKDYQVTVSMASSSNTGYTLKNSLAQSFEKLEDALEYANQMVEKAEELYAKKQPASTQSSTSTTAAPATKTLDAELVDLIKGIPGIDVQAKADIMAALNDYEQDVRSGKETYNTDTLVYMLHMGYGLEKGQATILEQAFAKAYNFGTAQAVAVAPEVQQAPSASTTPAVVIPAQNITPTTTVTDDSSAEDIAQYIFDNQLGPIEWRSKFPSLGKKYEGIGWIENEKGKAMLKKEAALDQEYFKNNIYGKTFKKGDTTFTVKGNRAIQHANEMGSANAATKGYVVNTVFDENDKSLGSVAVAVHNVRNNIWQSVNSPEVTTNQVPGPGPVVSNIGQPLNFSPNITYERDRNSGYHAGAKVKDVLKGNVLTHEYFDEMTVAYQMEEEGGVTAIAPESRRVYKKRDKYSLNPRVSHTWLRPGAITVGTHLTLGVDEQWDGTINDDGNYQYGGPVQRPDRVSDYLGADGRVSLDDEAIYGNVPIKIMDTKGNTVAYLPRVDWVTAKYPGTDDYRNVVDVITDEEGNVIDDNNVETQKQRLLELRRKIIEGYNNGRKVMPTAVAARSAGIALRDTAAKASEMLPDPSLRFGISAIGEGLVTVGAYEEAVSNVIFPSYMNDGKFANTPGALIPDSSGRLHFEPLWTNRLGKPEIDTTIRAIEIYLTVGSAVSPEAQARAEADAAYIQRHTGFDVTTPRGLESFINQYYYYSRSFDGQLTTVNTAVMGQPTRRRPEFMLSIARDPAAGRDKVEIKAGVSYLSRTQRAQIDQNGRIHPDFARLLHDPSSGLASRFRNIVLARPERGLRGLNSKGEIKEVIYRPESREFSYVSHGSYNDLVKEHSMTTLYGKLKLPGGPSEPYVYFAHPVTHLDPEVTMAAPTGRRVEPTEITEVLEEVKKEQAEGLTKSGRRRRTGIPGSNAFDPGLVEAEDIGNVPGKEVSLENLQKLLTFTPTGNRNGKTPAEVLVELERLGIASLPKGYNPFFQC